MQLMQYSIIENGNFMRFLLWLDKTAFSQLIECNKIAKNAIKSIKSSNAKIIAFAYLLTKIFIKIMLTFINNS